MKPHFKRISISILIIIICNTYVFSQLTLNVISIPNNTPANEDIYLASNENGWDPGDMNFTLENKGEGLYQITFTPTTDTLLYKFTRGAWSSVEGNTQGVDIENRRVIYTGNQKTVNVSIFSWKDLGPGSSTAAENVSVLEDIYIPQLDRTRRIWVYLPPDYETTSKSYPVLYMQDGQNLFDVNTSFTGEWEIDESLNELFAQGDEGVIIVGIDHGGVSRIDEYSPWINADYGGGEGDKYVQFIVNTLKPEIDQNLRTKADRLNTGIMGSSLGGLISLYAAIEYQETFSKVGVFSPSLWFSDEVYTHIEATGKNHEMKIYLLGGELESESLIQEMNRLVTSLHTAGFEDSEIKMLTHQDGEHNEWYWRREFPECYSWLFNNTNLSLPASPEVMDVRLFPNPFSDHLSIISSGPFKAARVEIYREDGTLVSSDIFPSVKGFNTTSLKNGVYIFKLISSDNSVYTEKLLHISR